MQALLAIALLLLLEPASCDDTVAYKIGGNMMYQLSEILSPEECHSFYTKIAGQEENEELELEQLLEGNNPINSRKRRAITNPEQCKKNLSHWLDSKGDSVYWDHLAEALQAIGRSDVSLEHLGKNLNEDKNLETEKDVGEYHKMVEEYLKMVQSQTSSLHLENKSPEQEQLCQDKESTKILFDPGNLEHRVMHMLKTESLPPYKIIPIGWLDMLVDYFFWGIPKTFVLNLLALSLFYKYMRRHF